MRKLEYFIDRAGQLFCNGDKFGAFESEGAAANMAIRHAQDNDAAYVILYQRRS